MPEIEDRLMPQDGLSDFRIVLARIETAGRGIGNFTFQITGPGNQSAEISLQIHARADDYGFDPMVTAAHDDMIDVLRHLLHQTDRLRSDHERRLVRARRPANSEKEISQQQPSSNDS